MNKHIKPASKRELLAHTIADAMGDPQQVNLYLQYCRKYPLSLVLRAYGEARSTPIERIRKARAALFFFLIKQYDNERQHPRCH